VKIPFVDLWQQHNEVKRDLEMAFARTLKKGDFILGEELVSFEKEFSNFCNSRYAVGVSSGTAALFLSALALGIKEGDEVILPDFTYIATGLAVSYTGARPVFVDIQEDTYNIDIAKVKKAINKKTKAIIPVHLYGQPANMPEILKVAKGYNLKVIEDVAQAHGAEIKMPDEKWRVLGSLGDAGCFSFYPSKNLGALGDAGMVVTDNESIYKKLLMLRDYGRVSKYEHTLIGYNSRLDTLQAAMLRIKLKRLKKWNALRRKAAVIYNELLRDIPGVIIPYASRDVRHVYHVYAIRVKRRDGLLDFFKKNGIACIVHYPIPLHLQKAYSHLGYKKGDFPVSEKVAGEIISLPMYPHIKENQIKFVVNTIKKFIKG